MTLRFFLRRGRPLSAILLAFLISAPPRTESGVSEGHLHATLWGDLQVGPAEEEGALPVRSPLPVEEWILEDGRGGVLARGHARSSHTFSLPAPPNPPPEARLGLRLRSPEGTHFLSIPLDAPGEAEVRPSESPSAGAPYRRLVAELHHRAEVSLRRGHREAARWLLDQALHLDPGHAEARALRERLEEFSGTERLRALRREAEDHRREGRPQAALEALERFLEMEPEDARALRMREEIQREWEETRRRETARLLKEARERENSGDLKGAGRLFREALALDASCPEARAGLARVAATQERSRNLQRFERALETGDTPEAQAAFQRLERFLPRNQRERLRARLEESRRAGAEDRSARAEQTYALGLEAYRRGNFQEALRFFEETLRIDPTHGRAALAKRRLLEDRPELASDAKRKPEPFP